MTRILNEGYVVYDLNIGSGLCLCMPWVLNKAWLEYLRRAISRMPQILDKICVVYDLISILDEGYVVYDLNIGQD